MKNLQDIWDKAQKAKELIEEIKTTTIIAETRNEKDKKEPKKIYIIEMYDKENTVTKQNAIKQLVDIMPKEHEIQTMTIITELAW